MAEQTKKYTYQTVHAGRSSGIEATTSILKNMNSRGEQGYRFVGTFPLPSGGAPDVFIIMEKETEA